MYRAFLALFAATLLACGLFAGDSSPATAAPADAATLHQAASTLNWNNCQPSGFQCATLKVPIDYTKPGGATLDLALIRLPATNQSQRIGSLLANPGGPGGSAIDFMKAWAGIVPNSIRARFDLVAFDPRGVGLSTPIVCHDTLQQLIAEDPTPDNDAEWKAGAAATKQFADDCGAKYGSLLSFVGTKNVARDMESIRIALGEDKLTYVGYSYGTAIGAVYADMYPQRVRAFVLDGAVDLSQSFEDSNRTQMVGFERALDAYLADCRQKQCALTREGDPATVIDTLLAQAEAKPIPAPGEDRPAGPGETLLGIISALYSQSEWPALTRAVQDGLNGDGSVLVELTDQYLRRNRDGSYPNLIEANAAVNYVDSDCPKDPEAYKVMAGSFAKAAPHFGASAATGSLMCAYWPAKADPLTVPRAAGAAPIVVISTTNDPATPYEWGVAMSKQLESGKLITHRGDGHTIYLQGDSCVDQAVNAYILNLTVPEAGKSCGNGPPPPESNVSPTSGPSATGTTATSQAPTATQSAPGAPNTGSSNKSSGSGIILLIAGLFVVAAVAGALAVVQFQRRR